MKNYKKNNLEVDCLYPTLERVSISCHLKYQMFENIHIFLSSES